MTEHVFVSDDCKGSPLEPVVNQVLRTGQSLKDKIRARVIRQVTLESCAAIMLGVG